MNRPLNRVNSNNGGTPGNGSRGNGRKQSDWLTQNQMMQRTGRSSEALSRAVDALVRHRLIEVRNEDGALLDTPEQRRRCGGRLYFSVKNMPADRRERTGRKTETHKSEEVASQDRSSGYRGQRSQQKCEVEDAITEEAAGKSELLARKSGVRKANTTKETGTKYLQKEKSYKDLETSSGNGPRFAFDAPSADVSRFLDAYHQLMKEFVAQSGNGLPASPGVTQEITHHADANITDAASTNEATAHHLLQRYSFEHLMNLLLRFLHSQKSSDNPNYSLNAFAAALKSLLVHEIKERLLRPRSAPPGLAEPRLHEPRPQSPRIHGGWSRGADRLHAGDASRLPGESPPQPRQPHS